jgi:hypothetical protein
MSIKVPVYGIRFVMSSVVDGPQDQQFHNYRFMTDGFITDPDQYDEYKSMAEVFKATPVVLRDMEGAQDETSDTSGGGRVNVTEEMAQKESRF